MIIRTTFRRAEGLEAHLLNTVSNEAVSTRADMFRGGVSDLHLALRFMDGISRTNGKALRSFIHVVVAPAKALDAEGLAQALTTLEEEYEIGHDAPRVVVEHAKGARPSHFHIIYSVVDLHTGKAIKSHNSYAKDELVGRRLEVAVGEPIVPGPHLAANIDELTARAKGRRQVPWMSPQEADELAGILSSYLPIKDRDQSSRKDRRQAERLGFDKEAFSGHLYALFESADRDLVVFAASLEKHGYAMSRGDKAVLVGDDAAGFQMPLARCLRREGKAAGKLVDLEERDLVALHSSLHPAADERDAGLKRAQQRAGRDFEREIQLGLFEALGDRDGATIDAYRAKQENSRAKKQTEGELQRATLKARREQILETYRRRDEVRWLRVDAAFRSARIFGSPAARRLAFGLVAAGVLLSGAGLVAALLAGGFAEAAMPTRGRARWLSIKARTERERDRKGLSDDLRRARAESPPRSRPGRRARFSFDDIPKDDRFLAGYYVEMKLGKKDSAEGKLRSVERALGPKVTSGLKEILKSGSPLQVKRVASWYQSIPPKRRSVALSASLKRNFNYNKYEIKTEGSKTAELNRRGNDKTKSL